jgi:hypothetical protein
MPTAHAARADAAKTEWTLGGVVPRALRRKIPASVTGDRKPMLNQRRAFRLAGVIRRLNTKMPIVPVRLA